MYSCIQSELRTTGDHFGTHLIPLNISGLTAGNLVKTVRNLAIAAFLMHFLLTSEEMLEEQQASLSA